MTQVSLESLLLVGKVIGPHGLEGTLRIRSYAESERSFLDNGRIFLRTVSGAIHEFTAKSLRPHKKNFLMELEGLTSLDQTEGFKEAEIFIRREALLREGDEYFWFELLGLRVYMNTGEYLGVIAQIIPTGSNDIYVIKEGNREILVPATHEVVQEIDPENGRVIILNTEGLLDLNAV